MHDTWEMQRREGEKHCTKLGKNKSEVHKNNHNHKTGFITVFEDTSKKHLRIVYIQKDFPMLLHLVFLPFGRLSLVSI